MPESELRPSPHHCPLHSHSDSSSPLSPLPSPFLLRRITDLDGDFRVRLSSIEAAEVTPELIGLMAERRDRICPHLHLPLQSGSDAVLAPDEPPRDGRGSSSSVAARFGPHWIRPALTTDVIVGFPGETEADFAATCRVVEEVGFAKVHVFRFSPRQGTPAADMAGQVPGRIAQRRATELGKLGKMLRDAVLSGTSGPPVAGVGRRCRLPASPAGWAAPPTTMPRLPCPAGGN